MVNTLELVLALLAGAVLVVGIFRSLNLPPVLGYLMVGAAVGPHAMNLMPDSDGARYLAEFGVVFLMFTIGLEFSLARLYSMKRIVFGLGAMQVLASIVLVMIVGRLAGLGWGAGFALGGTLAMSSTARQNTRRASQASAGSATVTTSIHRVLSSAERSAGLAADISVSSGDLSQQTATLKQNVARFLEKVRKADGAESSELIEWNDSLTIGQKEIDDEHGQIMATINDLHRAISSGADAASVGSSFQRMMDYTRTHFSHEEALMAARGYPDLTDHKRAHDGFDRRLNQLHERFQQGHREAGTDLLNLLSSWWMTHISTADTQLANFLHQRPASMAAR